VPRGIVLSLGAMLILQIVLHANQTAKSAQRAALPAPPAIEVLRAASFGEDVALAKLIMLWLQSYDNQPGISIPFAALDYGRLIAWLRAVLTLDPDGAYPLLSASRIYSEVPDAQRQRAILDFVKESFLADPNLRWPWMAHAVYVAKHRLKDMDLALAYARLLAAHATGPQVPHWARQMVIFVLEDMGEIEAAKVLLGGLLDSGQISDPHERWFLSNRLEKLEAQGAAGAANP